MTQDWVFGLLAIAAGLVLCFRGYVAFRIIIPLWGAFVGFSLGAGLIAGAMNGGFLRTATGWLVGLAFAVVFAIVAYLSYEVAVVLAMGSIGFALGSSLMVALGVSWSWLIVLVGVALGVLLAFAAIAADLPGVLLLVLSALGGASAVTLGLMLVSGAIDTREFTDEDVTEQAASAGWWWYVVYAVFAVAGTTVQIESAQRLRGSVRDGYAASR